MRIKSKSTWYQTIHKLKKRKNNATHRGGKTNYLKEKVEETDLYKSLVNKIMAMHK